jgi:hypothetical protein
VITALVPVCQLALGAQSWSGGAAEQKTGLAAAARWDCQASFFPAARFSIGDVGAFAGELREPSELHTLARAHVIAWRKDPEGRGLSAASTVLAV